MHATTSVRDFTCATGWKRKADIIRLYSSRTLTLTGKNYAQIYRGIVSRGRSEKVKLGNTSVYRNS